MFISDTTVTVPQVLAVRGDSLAECVERMNAELRYSSAIMVTATEYTADEEGYILLVTTIGDRAEW